MKVKPGSYTVAGFGVPVSPAGLRAGGAVNRRLPPTVSAATIAAVIVVATTVVSTRGFVSVVLTATTRAEGDASDHPVQPPRLQLQGTFPLRSPFSEFPYA